MPAILPLLPYLPRLKIVDVGAMWTGVDVVRYAGIEKALPHEIVGFEPVAAEHRKLLALNRPFHRYFPYFIGDGSTGTFYECKAPFTSSLFEPDPAIVESFEYLAEVFQVVRTHKIQTTRLDDIPEIAGVDFLKVDVQGGEMLVFEGARERLKSVLIVDVEADFIPFYKKQPLYADIDIFLRSQGFMLHQITRYGLTFAGKVARETGAATSQQAGWGDAVYVRDFPTFETLDRLQLIKLAAMLHENYGSYDLAARVLGVYDRKMLTDLRPRYGTLMASMP